MDYTCVMRAFWEADDIRRAKMGKVLLEDACFAAAMVQAHSAHRALTYDVIQ